MSAPWLDYTGQSPAELLECRATHRHDSILAAFATGLQYKQDRLGKKCLSKEEQLFLAITALEGEVNNGGYDQFFVNSSHVFTPVIVSALRRVGCEKTAAITQKAIAALDVPRVSAKAVREAMAKPSATRTRAFEECDQEFYALTGDDYEIAPNLLAFVEAHATQFEFAAGYEAPEPSSGTGFSAITAIETRLLFTKDKSTEGLLALARHAATEVNQPATEDDIRAAVVLHQFEVALRSADPASAEPLAAEAFERARRETVHMTVHFRWIEKLLAAGHTELADRWLLTYLEFLPHTGALPERHRRDVDFWKGLVVGERRQQVPRSAARFAELFGA